MLGTFRAELAGRRNGWGGRAVYGQCLNRLHIFLLTDSIPRSSITVHPMGTPPRGTHPLRRGWALDRTLDTTGIAASPGPFFLEAVIAPDTVVEADSGSVMLDLALDGSLKGSIAAWVSGPAWRADSLSPFGTVRRLRVTFTADRDRSLESGLTHGLDCAR